MAKSNPMSFQERLKKIRWLLPTLKILFFYSIFILLTRLLTLSIVTYFTVTPTSLLQDIHETLGHYELIFMSLSSFLFVILLHALNPFANGSNLEILNAEWIEKKFIPGWIHGTFFAGILVTSILCFGSAKYLGYFVKANEEPFEFLYILIQILALVLFCYSEAWLFHHHLLQSLPTRLNSLVKSQVITLSYVAIKWLQFDLSSMSLVSCYLIALALFHRTQKNTFVYGAGFLAGLLIFFHPLSSLPIFGHEMIGVFFIQQEPSLTMAQSSHLKVLPFFQIESQGPLSSLLLQGLLILDITVSVCTKTLGLRFFK